MQHVFNRQNTIFYIEDRHLPTTQQNQSAADRAILQLMLNAYRYRQLQAIQQDQNTADTTTALQHIFNNQNIINSQPIALYIENGYLPAIQQDQNAVYTATLRLINFMAYQLLYNNVQLDNNYNDRIQLVHILFSNTNQPAINEQRVV